MRGFELDDPHCFVGAFGSEEPCELVAGDGLYRATFEPLPSDQGITIDGVIVGRIAPVAVDPPPLPDRRSSNRLPVTLAVAVLGCIGSFAVYRWARRRGRNEVFAGGAADAAFGDLPPPDPDGSNPTLAADLARRRRPSRRPRHDRVRATQGDRPLGGGGAAQRTARRRHRRGLAVGARRARGDRADRSRRQPGDRQRPAPAASSTRPTPRCSQGFIGESDPYVTGEYDPEFAVAWGQVAAMQKQRIASSGWWKHLPPGGGLGGSGRPGGAPFGLIAFAALAVIWFGSAVTAFFGVFSSWPAALAARPAVPVDRRLLRVPGAAAGPQRTGIGADPAHRVVPALPARQRVAPRRMGVGARAAARVQRVGGGARRGRRLVGCARSIQRAGPGTRLGGAGAARHESGLDPIVAHGSATEEQRWLEWWLRRIERRFRRWRRRGRQPRFLVSGYRPSPGRRCIAFPAWRQRVILVIDDRTNRPSRSTPRR